MRIKHNFTYHMCIFMIRKLIDRLDNMKKHATGNGSSQCVLCADSFGMLGASAVICVDCRKVGLLEDTKKKENAFVFVSALR